MALQSEKGAPPRSATDRRFGPYLLQDLLGAGGMGEVYRARDTRLDRDVAVKMLSSEFSSDPERLTRLAREARLLASLNHPNIAAIYELEEVEGISGLVLEIVDGQTLAELLRDGPLHESQALSIADQIASALLAAHETGIVHRDLKPSNIKITPGGTVKVLDFGVAKALEPRPADEVGVPTRSTPAGATRAGVVLGTPAYMSPEQARGEPLNERTDIWAFGVVLYEMLTGRRPFEGSTTTDTLAAVLKEEPDWSRVPARAQRLLRACLQKDPGRRLRAIADARLLLDDRLATTSSPTPIRWLWLAWAVFAVIVALAILLMALRRSVPQPHPVRFQIHAPPGLAANAPVVSPDGRTVAFVTSPEERSGVPGLWLHSLETGISRLLFKPEKVMAPLPFWSPDSRWVAFTADAKLMKIEVATGVQQTVTDVQPPAVGGAWSSGDIILFPTVRGLARISAQGGNPELVTQVDPARGEIGHFLPAFLPDRRRFLYLRASPTTDVSGIYLASVDSKPGDQPVRRLVTTRSGPMYVPPVNGEAFLLFLRGSTLLSQRFDDRKLELVGEPVPVADRIELFGVPGPRFGFASVSGTGVLAYRQRQSVHATLVWVDRHGNEVGTLVREPVEEPNNLRLSPDGRRLALTVAGNLWVYDLGGRPPIKLTNDGTSDVLLWSLDGSRLIYESLDVPAQLLSISADGTADTPKAVSPPGHYHPNSWSVGGDLLIASVGTYSATSWDIVTIPVQGPGQPSPLVQTQFIEGIVGAAISPDGRWLAYTSNATGRMEVWLRPFPGPGKPERISPDGGSDPVWAKNGRELFYLSQDRMMAVSVGTDGSALRLSTPVVLFKSPYLHRPNTVLSYDVTADGRFVMMKQADTGTAPPPIHVVLNWKPDHAR